MIGFPIPRHQIETTARDYARMLRRLVGGGDRRRETGRFEEAFAERVGCRNAIAVASGTQGLHLVLKHLGIQRHAEAIVPAFNYFAVVERFLDLGMRPVFADVRRDDLNIDPAAVEACVTRRSRVLLATHMFGQPCNMDALVRQAKRHNLVLIEDCAHAFGSLYDGRHVGTFGRAGIFSLSVLKLMTSFGGGMITTNDDELAGAIRDDLARWGTDGLRAAAWRRFAKGAMLDLGTRTLPFGLGAWPALRLARIVRPDIQRRMMTHAPQRIRGWAPERIPPLHAFQSSLGLSQLRRADEFIKRRRNIMERLDEALSGQQGVTPLRRSPNVRHNGLYYGVLAERSEELSRHLFARGIDSETAEYCNCADLPIYHAHQRDCQNARFVQSRILRLPSHPRLTVGDVARIARAIRTFYERCRQPTGRVAAVH